MNSFILQTSLFIGIIPALILLYIGLKGFEGKFKDKLIFLTFIVGIVIGTISVAIEYFTQAIGLIYIILFPILEQLFKTIVLNLGRFQEKQETTIYGFSLGLGFGSVFTPLNMIDEARSHGITIDAAGLSASLGIPVIEAVATEGRGVSELREALARAAIPSVGSGQDGGHARAAHDLAVRFRRHRPH